MAFDPSKDTLLWQTPEMSKDKMFINIKRYSNYAPKVEFVRHVPTNQDPNALRSAGRMSADDLQFVAKYLPTVLQKLQELQAQQPQQPQQFQQPQQQTQQFQQQPGPFYPPFNS